MTRVCFKVLMICFLTIESSFASPLYEEAKKEAEQVRLKFAQSYQVEPNSEQKNLMLSKASLEFQRLITERLAPPWYGTKWKFHGVSQEPGKGAIACGYFVTTLLRDAGINLERVALAQQASENIIKSLVSSSSIRRFSNKSLSDFLTNVDKWGEGIYIVGLDYHVGFISVEPETTYFVHSSYQAPHAVIREVALESKILASSKYRVLGKLSDKKFLEGWINGVSFTTIK